jgi:hypothetical protein
MYKYKMLQGFYNNKIRRLFLSSERKLVTKTELLFAVTLCFFPNCPADR